MPRRSKVSQRAAHADAGRVVHGRRAHAAGFRVVHVPVGGVAHGNARIHERLLERVPGFPGSAHHRNRSVAAVKIVMHVSVRLQPSEIRQHVLIGPLVVAQRGPPVVILRQSPQENLAVHRSRTADGTATGNLHGPLLLRRSDGLIRPVIRAARRGGNLTVAVAQLRRPALKIHEIGAGFQQQNRPAGILGEP